jgi:hypothetical protein
MEWLFKNEVWKWLVENREWLFQGIGVVALGWLGWIVSGPWIGNRKESDKSPKKETAKHSHIGDDTNYNHHYHPKKSPLPKEL